MEGEVVMIVLGIEAWSFETHHQFFPVSGVFNQVVDRKVLSALTDYWLDHVVAVPVVGIIVTVQKFHSLFGVVFPAQKPNEEFF